MSLIENGFGGFNLLKTVQELDKRVHELEAKVLAAALHQNDPVAVVPPPPVPHEEEHQG